MLHPKKIRQGEEASEEEAEVKAMVEVEVVAMVEVEEAVAIREEVTIIKRIKRPKSMAFDWIS